jgi:hypothetical protein
VHGHPKQYIQVGTIFNYRIHFGFPGNQENTPILALAAPAKGVF